MKRLGILLFSLGLFFIKGWAAEWQWSVPVSKVIAPETGWHPQAFLWIPEDCMQVRAVMIGTHNMCEETLFENELFRRESIDGELRRQVGPAVESGFGKPGSLLADVGRFGGDQRIW